MKRRIYRKPKLTESGTLAMAGAADVCPSGFVFEPVAQGAGQCVPIGDPPTQPPR